MKKYASILILSLAFVLSGTANADCIPLLPTSQTDSFETLGQKKVDQANKDIEQAKKDQTDLKNYVKSGNSSDISGIALRAAVAAACATCNRMTCGDTKKLERCKLNCGGGNGKNIISCTKQGEAAAEKAAAKTKK